MPPRACLGVPRRNGSRVTLQPQNPLKWCTPSKRGKLGGQPPAVRLRTGNAGRSGQCWKLGQSDREEWRKHPGASRLRRKQQTYVQCSNLFKANIDVCAHARALHDVIAQRTEKERL
jgi:hypothetical protein